MIKKKWMALGIALVLTSATPVVSFADTGNESSTTVMESCGAYLFEWRPVDCGNGHYFAILVGGNSIAERNVMILRIRLIR